MFSGIVERTVTLTDIRIEQQNKTFTFRADFCGELKIDQSIAHNGVCPVSYTHLTLPTKA